MLKESSSFYSQFSLPRNIHESQAEHSGIVKLKLLLLSKVLVTFEFSQLIDRLILQKQQSKQEDTVPHLLKRICRRRSSITDGKSPRKPCEIPQLLTLFQQNSCLFRKKAPTLIRIPTYAEILAEAEVTTYIRTEPTTSNSQQMDATTEKCECSEKNEENCPCLRRNEKSYREETRNRISKDVLVARNPEILGYDENGNRVYNEWLLPKNQFLKKYSVESLDEVSETFQEFFKREPVKAIEISDQVVRWLGGRDGRAQIKIEFGCGTMDVEEGGLLTESYAISRCDSLSYVKVS